MLFCWFKESFFFMPSVACFRILSWCFDLAISYLSSLKRARCSSVGLLNFFLTVLTVLWRSLKSCRLFSPPNRF